MSLIGNSDVTACAQAVINNRLATYRFLAVHPWPFQGWTKFIAGIARRVEKRGRADSVHVYGRDTHFAGDAGLA